MKDVSDAVLRATLAEESREFINPTQVNYSVYCPKCFRIHQVTKDNHCRHDGSKLLSWPLCDCSKDSHLSPDQKHCGNCGKLNPIHEKFIARKEELLN